MMDNCEAYYSQVCYTCGVDKDLIHYNRADTDRTCRACFAKWLGVPIQHACHVLACHSLKLYHKLAQSGEHERPARPCPKCGDGRRIYLGANFARCCACGWTYAFDLPRSS